MIDYNNFDYNNFVALLPRYETQERKKQSEGISREESWKADEEVDT